MEQCTNQMVRGAGVNGTAEDTNGIIVLKLDGVPHANLVKRYRVGRDQKQLGSMNNWPPGPTKPSSLETELGFPAPNLKQEGKIYYFVWGGLCPSKTLKHDGKLA